MFSMMKTEGRKRLGKWEGVTGLIGLTGLRSLGGLGGFVGLKGSRVL